MVSELALFDTNILIDYLGNSEAALIEIDGCTDPAINLITWMEVMVGVAPNEEVPIRLFLRDFYCFPVSEEIIERAVVLRRTLRLKLADAIIFATAQITGYTLVTRNTRDFDPSQSGVRVPYTL